MASILMSCYCCDLVLNFSPMFTVSIAKVLDITVLQVRK